MRRPLETGQYLSMRYTERLADAGIALSVGSRGDVRGSTGSTPGGYCNRSATSRRRSMKSVTMSRLRWPNSRHSLSDVPRYDSVPGGNPRFSPKISEVKATDQQRPAQAPEFRLDRVAPIWDRILFPDEPADAAKR